jgi:PAS domain S-box-containing protein
MQESLKETEEELRRGERLLASVVQSVDDCIFTADVDGRLVTMNPAGRRLLGYRERDFPGRVAADLLGPEDRRRVGAALARAAEQGAGWNGQVTGWTRRGQGFPAHLAVRCIFDARGQLMGTVGVLRDLTEQVETERRLVQREKLASLGEMAAGVAHEIRNPLGGIKMATRLLSSGDLDGRPLSQEMARAILAGIAEIEGIINSLLDYTRDTRLERAEYEVLRILDPVVESGAAAGRARGITVTYGTVEREAVALGDGQKLRQVFANVLQNALEAFGPRADAGRVEVTLRAEGDRAVVEVSDTGLGMSIVKKIVDLHGGDIAVESAPGRGTRVRIALPAAAVSHAVETGGDA